jgi:hypothetical protein
MAPGERARTEMNCNGHCNGVGPPLRQRVHTETIVENLVVVVLLRSSGS